MVNKARMYLPSTRYMSAATPEALSDLTVVEGQCYAVLVDVLLGMGGHPDLTLVSLV